MSIDSKFLKNILNKVKIDIYDLKIKGELTLSYIQDNDVKIDFSNYETNGGIGLRIHGKSVPTYFFHNKQIYINSILDNLEVNLEDDEKENIAKLIEHFIDILLNSFSNKKQDIGVDYLVSSFIKEINDEPIPVSVKIKVNGLYIKGVDHFESSFEEFKILIRRPTDEDFKFPLFGVSIQKNIPSAIIEISLETKPSKLKEYNNKGYNYFLNIAEKVIFALRILKLGSIEIINRNVSSKSILLSPMNDVGFPNQYVDGHPRYNYGLDSKNFESFLEIYKFVNFYIKPLKTDNGFETLSFPFSYNFYCDALEGRIQSDKRIAYIIMGLESIYCSAEDKSDVSYKLRIRCAKFLGLLGYNGLEILNLIKIAYGIRSSFAHGGKTDFKNLEKKLDKLNIKSVNDFETLLMNYLRISIVLEISLSNKYCFLMDLDNTLIKNDDNEFKEKYLKNTVLKQLDL